MRLIKALGSLALFSQVSGKVLIDSITGTTATISWDQADKADIELTRLDARERGVKDAGSNGKYTLDNLVAGAAYSVRVTEENKEPEIIEFNTKPSQLSGTRFNINSMATDG